MTRFYSYWILELWTRILLLQPELEKLTGNIFFCQPTFHPNIIFGSQNFTSGSGSSIRHCKSDASKITFLVVPYAKRVTLFLLCHMYILYSIWFSLFLSLPYIPLHCRDRIRAKPMWVFHLYFIQLPNELILGGILGKLRMGPEWHF